MVCVVCYCLHQQNTQEEVEFLRACQEGDLQRVKQLSSVVAVKDVRDQSVFGRSSSALHKAARLV